MTPAERRALRQLLKLLDALLDLTGCTLRPETREHIAALRQLAAHARPSSQAPTT
ncbi:hypothetical protein [Novosphingobium huizhouense]|uniref:hypothetical protein n=1 Tax=Novosphingobium huizhouense TaxID=2866625 RepID=UPI001CD8DA6A|nr:hypothetical protein [Novosphingobium huizhouense]